MSEFTLLKDRLVNLTAGINEMSNEQKILVNKAFPEHVRDDMAELLTLRRAQPANEPLKLEQMMVLHDCEDRVAEIKKSKVERLEERIRR